MAFSFRDRATGTRLGTGEKAILQRRTALQAGRSFPHLIPAVDLGCCPRERPACNTVKALCNPNTRRPLCTLEGPTALCVRHIGRERLCATMYCHNGHTVY